MLTEDEPESIITETPMTAAKISTLLSAILQTPTFFPLTFGEKTTHPRSYDLLT